MTFHWYRVVSKAFSRPDNLTQDFYDVDLELSPIPDSHSILIGVVIEQFSGGSTETGTPTVTVGNGGLGPSWNLLAINSYPVGDPSGAGTQAPIGVSLWWTDLPASNVDVMYVQQSDVAALGAYVYQVGGITEGFSPVTGSGADLVTRPGDNSFGGLTAVGDSVLFGAYGVQLLSYAYGCDITGTSGTTAITNLDRGGMAYKVYPAEDQGLDPPWIFTGHKTVAAGAVQLDSHIDNSYPYSPNGRAWVAAAIPLEGTFSVIQQSLGVGGTGILSDISVSLPNPL